MSKEMTLDVLSSIKGAKASKVVDDLFEVIKSGQLDTNSLDNNEDTDFHKQRHQNLQKPSTMKDHWSPSTGPRHKDQLNTALFRKERRDNMTPVKVVSPETEEKYYQALEMPFRWENTDGSTRINLCP